MQLLDHKKYTRIWKVQSEILNFRGKNKVIDHEIWA